MDVWSKCILTGIYTLSPLHCGTGQTTGAIDLPIARDAATGFPTLPPTTIKGVARDYCMLGGMDESTVNDLFGKQVEQIDKEQAEIEDSRPVSLEAGALIFSEGRLLAYPVRSLNRPFFHVTCPMILDRLARDLRALGVDGFLSQPWQGNGMMIERGRAYVSDRDLAGNALVLEDLVFEPNEVIELDPLKDLGLRFGDLIPKEEDRTRMLLSTGLILIPNEDFSDLMRRVIPVQARIKLNRQSKTSENLWYEEYLPSDCLFLSIIGERPGRVNNKQKSAIKKLKEAFSILERIQMGGNETVGYGLCRWTRFSEKQVSES